MLRLQGLTNYKSKFPVLSEPQIVQTEALATAYIRFHIPCDEIPQVVGPAIAEAVQAVSAQGVGPAGPVFAYYYRIREGKADFDVGVPVSSAFRATGRVVPGQLLAARVLRRIYTGPYDGLRQAWGEFKETPEVAKCAAPLVFWEAYLTDPATTPDPAQWKTELNYVLAD